MKIRNNISENKYSFKAIPIAKVRLKGASVRDEITLYQLNNNDKKFLYKMIERINLKKLYPSIKDKSYFGEWKQIIKEAIEDIENKTKVVLAARENKPCGIISYTETAGNKSYYIDHLASWPIRAGEGTKGTGKALIRECYNDAEIKGKSHLFLIPSYIQPRNKSCKKFYTEVGMKADSLSGVFEIRQDKNCPVNIFHFANMHLGSYLRYRQLKNTQEVNLNEKLNLDYIPGFKNHIKVKLKKIKEKFRK